MSVISPPSLSTYYSSVVLETLNEGRCRYFKQYLLCPSLRTYSVDHLKCLIRVEGVSDRSPNFPYQRNHQEPCIKFIFAVAIPYELGYGQDYWFLGSLLSSLLFVARL
ncbi:hypothetical protein PTI98_009685 [Pleurotus ostreatus]|nr:hypothetical protein PTI98_009685 [Pleurotus ostreatus]